MFVKLFMECSHAANQPRESSDLNILLHHFLCFQEKVLCTD